MANVAGEKWWKVVGVVWGGNRGGKMWERRFSWIGEKHCAHHSVSNREGDRGSTICNFTFLVPGFGED
nr:hypothetical protein [Tanacetum cinerariifolium]